MRCATHFTSFGIRSTCGNIEEVKHGQIREDTTMSVSGEGQERRGSRWGLRFLQAEQTQHRVWALLYQTDEGREHDGGAVKEQLPRAQGSGGQRPSQRCAAPTPPVPRGAMSHGRRKVNTQLERSRVLERVRSRSPCTARREPINLAFEPRPQLSRSLAPDIPIVPFAPCGLIVTYRPDR